MNIHEAKSVLEALIFAAPAPVTLRELAGVLELHENTVKVLVQQLRDDYHAKKGGMILQEVAGGWQFCTNPAFAPYVAQLGRPPRNTPLSQAALETLAIIAYRQPITRAEIEAIRGVRVDSALTTLEERQLICEVGRKDAVGRPILYGTTEAFLQSFGLRDLKDLPPLPEEFALQLAAVEEEYDN